jgi:hypothetical protein
VGPISPLVPLGDRDDHSSSTGIDAMSILGIDLDLLTPAERRDLSNALLRAAWSASMEGTRVLLLDLFMATDAASLWEPET